jgi:hypothetical protein
MNMVIPRHARRKIAALMPMLTVHANRDACSPGGSRRFEGRQVPCVHDGGPELAEQAEEFGVLPHAMAGRLVQGQRNDVVASKALLEFGHLGQCKHRVPIGPGWHAVDEVDDTIFQTADVEAIDDVQHQWRRTHRMHPGRSMHTSPSGRLVIDGQGNGPVNHVTQKGLEH